MPLTIKGKLSTCTMSNIIEYEYVIGGPLKGGQPASKGGRMLPPPPPPERNPAYASPHSLLYRVQLLAPLFRTLSVAVA